MPEQKKKSFWRRMKLWKRIVLLIVVLFVPILIYVYYRPIGPRPTAPGKCPDFDQQLAEINKKWIFLFKEEGKIFLADIYGNKIRTLIDMAERLGEKGSNIWANASACSFGNHILVYCFVHEKNQQLSNGPIFNKNELLLINLYDSSVYVIKRDNKYSYFIDRTYWLSPDIFLMPVGEKGKPFSGPTGSADKTVFFRYDIKDLDNPSKVELPLRWHMVEQNTIFAWYKDSGTMIFHPAPDMGYNSTMIYDKDGLRPATREEWTKRNEKIVSIVQNNSNEDEQYPMIERRREKIDNDWLFTLLAKFHNKSLSQCRILFEDKVARVSKRDAYWVGDKESNGWDNDLKLYLWEESKNYVPYQYFYMDKHGHYRLWLSNCYYLGKAPITNIERKEFLNE